MCTMVTLRPETVFASEKNVCTNQIFSEKDVESIMPFFEILEKLRGTLAALAVILASITGVADIQEHCFG